MDRRSAQTEKIGEPPRRCRARRTQSRIRIDSISAPGQPQAHIIVETLSREHTGPRARQPRGRLPGIFQRFPCNFQPQPLLRIERRRFPWRDIEKLRIEAVYLFQKSTVFRIHRSRAEIGIVIPGHVPARGGNFRNRFPALQQ